MWCAIYGPPACQHEPSSEEALLGHSRIILLYRRESWLIMWKRQRCPSTAHTCVCLQNQLEIPATTKEMYGTLPTVASKVTSERLHLAGHCHPRPEYTKNSCCGSLTTGSGKAADQEPCSYVHVLKRDMNKMSMFTRFIQCITQEFN